MKEQLQVGFTSIGSAVPARRLFTALVATAAVGLAATTADAAIINTSRSNIKKPSVMAFILPAVPCGGICFGGSVEGDDCGTDADCSGGVCRAIVDGAPVVPLVPNAVNEDGDPSCTPITTFNEQAGSPVSGWILDQGGALLKMKSGGNKIVDPLNPVGTSGDVFLKFKMKGVVDGNGDPVNGTGSISILVRQQRLDRGDGDTTDRDKRYEVSLPVVNGAALVKTSLNAILNAAGDHGLPLFSMEILSVTLKDQNGNAFGAQGIAIKEPGVK